MSFLLALSIIGRWFCKKDQIRGKRIRKQRNFFDALGTQREAIKKIQGLIIGPMKYSQRGLCA